MVKQASPPIELVIESDSEKTLRAGMEMARRLGLDVRANARENEIAADLHLVLNDERLELRDASTKPGKGLYIDFSTLYPKQAARRGGFSRNQPLGRAIGKAAKVVLDATAGLGHDSALLACMGYTVIAVERSPIMAELLRDGLRRAEQSAELREALGGRLTIINADARDVLEETSKRPNVETSRVAAAPQSSVASAQWSEEMTGHCQLATVNWPKVDVCYIDPMFPPKRKASALAKKSIRMVRQIVGEDEDAADLLEAARRHVSRVVVKRPTYAPPLAPNPTASIAGKLVRYDLYAR